MEEYISVVRFLRVLITLMQKNDNELTWEMLLACMQEQDIDTNLPANYWEKFKNHPAAEDDTKDNLAQFKQDTQLCPGQHYICATCAFMPELLPDSTYYCDTPNVLVGENGKTIHINDVDMHYFKPWNFMNVTGGDFIIYDAPGKHSAQFIFKEFDSYGTGIIVYAVDAYDKIQPHTVLQYIPREDAFYRLMSPLERTTFLNKLHNAGYKWNADMSQLEAVEPNKDDSQQPMTDLFASLNADAAAQQVYDEFPQGIKDWYPDIIDRTLTYYVKGYNDALADMKKLFKEKQETNNNKQ